MGLLFLLGALLVGGIFGYFLPWYLSLIFGMAVLIASYRSIANDCGPGCDVTAGFSIFFGFFGSILTTALYTIGVLVGELLSR